MKTEYCSVCNRIATIKNGSNPFFVIELETGYVVIADFQFYKGYTIFISKVHVEELHELAEHERYQFLKEMSLVAEAVYKAFKPNKLNYELLGNTDAHAHWHIIPRYLTDQKLGTAIWAVDEDIRNNKTNKPSSSELENIKTRLLIELETVLA